MAVISFKRREQVIVQKAIILLFWALVHRKHIVDTRLEENNLSLKKALYPAIEFDVNFAPKEAAHIFTSNFFVPWEYVLYLGTFPSKHNNYFIYIGKLATF